MILTDNIERGNLFAGNIVPHSWYSKITAGGGKPDFVGITVLSELLFLYRKLGNPEIAESYSYYEKKFNLTKIQLQDATLRLHKSGVVERSFRTIEINGRKFPNELHLKINLDKLQEISSKDGFDGEDFSAIDKGKVLCNDIVRNSYSKDNYNKISIRKNRFSESSFFKRGFAKSGKGRNLNSFYPLSEDDCSKLQSISGREFTSRSINEILLKLSKKYTKHSFVNKAAFMGYMGKVLAHEMRDAVKISGESFKLNCNRDQGYENRETLLSKIENSRDTSYEAQVKRKLASTLRAETAYNVLQIFKGVQVTDCVARLLLSKHRDLKESEHSIILRQIQSVYGNHVDSLEIVGGKRKFCNRPGISRVGSVNDYKAESFKGFWGSLRKKLIEHLGRDGQAIDKSWFSKLEASLDHSKKILNLKAPTTFIKDWIQDRYGRLLEWFCIQDNYKVALL